MLAAEPLSFFPGQAPADPVSLFCQWFDHAVDCAVVEPHAMTLSTVDAAGRPSARVLILKDVTATDSCWHFSSSSSSRKGRDLAANPAAALTFYWPTLGRQVRIEGPVVLDPPQVTAADFAARSPTAQLLVNAADWQSYAVCAEAVEFWQADSDRHHLRLHYTRTADTGSTQSWSRTLLSP